MAIKNCIARLCQVMSNEYNIAGDTGSGGGESGRMVDFVSMFSPLLFFPTCTFIEKQNKNNKKVVGSSGRIFSKSFN